MRADDVLIEALNLLSPQMNGSGALLGENGAAVAFACIDHYGQLTINGQSTKEETRRDYT
ncbi:MAG: hypothetical protein QM705_10725 [Ancrocorticia sp.]